ncbi:hypothetical protein [Cryobacterium sp. TMT1-2-2]|uniref:hypothetical protein n=1 Tax=Cryobacterium sp. TMT1-2-2 TaxID=1259233 RepID=UPI00141BE19C|nr:hypothetical protein [Cryobacterium sp. TMT1-2-2]
MAWAEGETPVTAGVSAWDAASVRRCSIPAPSISGHRLTAALIAASGQSQGAEPLLARTHHGSVSNVFGVRMRPLPRL